MNNANMLAPLKGSATLSHINPKHRCTNLGTNDCCCYLFRSTNVAIRSARLLSAVGQRHTLVVLCAGTVSAVAAMIDVAVVGFCCWLRACRRRRGPPVKVAQMSPVTVRRPGVQNRSDVYARMLIDRKISGQRNGSVRSAVSVFCSPGRSAET